MLNLSGTEGMKVLEVLKKKDLVKKNDGEYIKGYVLIKQYSKQPTKNGGAYLGGTLKAQGSLGFKVWSSANCFADMDKLDYQDSVCAIVGKINIYNGQAGVIIEDCKAINESEIGISKADFYEEKYDAESYWNNLVKTVQANVSENALKVFELMFTEDVKEKFKVEFAASFHHDNCRSGLIAHTTKTVKIATLVKIYPDLFKRIGADLLFLGTALHDIGKLREYQNGVISEEGKRISHNTSGVLMLAKHEDEIVELMGETFYGELSSVISQHHGEYGEHPRTIAAFVIHQIDCMDSILTSLNQQLEGIEPDTQISVEGTKLI